MAKVFRYVGGAEEREVNVIVKRQNRRYPVPWIITAVQSD